MKSWFAETGYDRATGLYLYYKGEKLNIPAYPTREDALEALELLKVPFSEFPFAAQYDLSVALAALITAIVRRGLPSAPMFAIDAPMPGSGKGLIITIIGLIVLGRNPPLMNYSPREEEVEKRLDALLIQSAPVVAIDNIESTVYGEALCTVLTAEKKMSRVLGLSRMVMVPTNALFLATGNNLRFRGDITRRVLSVRIDPQCERPDARSFKRNLYTWIPAHRGELITACLTVLLAFWLAGKPDQDIPEYGSFEAWSRLVRHPLVWLGMPDPLLSRERVRGDDPDADTLSAVLTQWRAAAGDAQMSVAELIGVAPQHQYADLKHALLAVAADVTHPDQIDGTKLGNWLRRHKDKVCGGLRVRRVGEDTHSKTVLWQVTSC